MIFKYILNKLIYRKEVEEMPKSTKALSKKAELSKEVVQNQIILREIRKIKGFKLKRK